MKANVIILFCLQLQLAAYAQSQIDTLHVSDRKTTHLVCPDKVDYVQAGDYSLVQAEVVPELSNLVRIKATRTFEEPTSLTVVCDDRIYTVALVYGDEAPITFPVGLLPSQKAESFSGKLMPDYLLRELSDQLLDQKRRNCRTRKAEKDGIRIRMNSIYYHGDALFFELEIRNKTNLAFDVESCYWWITEKRQSKATNVQEYQVQPDYQRHRVSRVPGRTKVREVFVFEKMTIPDRRILKLELNEKALGNTGRKLKLTLKSQDILDAQQLCL